MIGLGDLGPCERVGAASLPFAFTQGAQMGTLHFTRPWQNSTEVLTRKSLRALGPNHLSGSHSLVLLDSEASMQLEQLPRALPRHQLAERQFPSIDPRPASSQPSIRIVIPAFNESDRIGPTLTDYCSHFGTAARVLVVTNGCTDDTSRVVRFARISFRNLDLIEVSPKIGKGGAIRIGLATGDEEFVGFVDADGSTSAAEFGRLYAIAQASHAQAVIASRWLTGAHVEPRQPRLRQCASRTFNCIVRWLFALHFADTQCGAKIFQREALRSILRELELCDFAADIEMLWRLDRAGNAVLEVPTVWADKPNGTKVKVFHVSWDMLRSVLYLRLRQSPLRQAPPVKLLSGPSVMPADAIERAVAFNIARSAQR